MTEATARNVFYPHRRVTSDPIGPSRTKQSFKKETDINFILAQSEKGLLVTHLNAHQGSYGDFIAAPDYHTALNRIHDADAAFMTIPASIRARFNNDAAQFLAFAQDTDNLAEMREMGLASPQAPNASTEAPPQPDPATPAPDAPAAPPTA